MSNKIDYEAEHLPAFAEGVPEQLKKSELFHDYLDRLKDGRDLRILIDAEGNQTGVGKTMLGSQLAQMMDIHGFDASETATMNVREFMDIYHTSPPGTVAYLQESEKSGDERRAMSNDVMNLSYTFAVLRTRQIFGIADLPDVEALDDRMIKLCDYRILVKDVGEAIVFKIDSNDFTGEKYYQKVEYLTWENLEKDDNYQELSRQKEEWIEGNSEEKYIPIEEFEEAKKNFYNKFTKKTRYECIKGIYDYMDEKCEGRNPLSQEELGNALGLHNEELALSQQRVSDIIKSDEFSDIYDG